LARFWGFAAKNHVRYLRTPNLARNTSKFINADGRLNKSGVSSGFQEYVRAFDRSIEALARSDIGSCYNLQVRVLPRVQCSTDFVDHLAHRDNFFSREVSTFFGKDLILNLDTCSTCPLKRAHHPDNVEMISETGVGVGDNRDRNCARETADCLSDLSHS